MNIAQTFVSRPIMTTLLVASIGLFGIIAYKQLPVSDLPSIDYPVIQVRVGYPGATPDTMANNIATPLERQFLQIDGLEVITSSSTQGNTSLVLQFALSKSVDAAATDVQAAISRSTGLLPVDLPSPPTFTKTNPNEQPILYIGLASDSFTAAQLYDFANTQVSQRIATVTGVSQVSVFATPPAVRIKADPSALAFRGMSIDDLTSAVRSGTSYQGAGQFDGSHRSFLLQPLGQLSTAEEYNSLIIKTQNGNPVYLRDVAHAYDSLQDERIHTSFWFRQREAPSAMVVLAVFRHAGSNAVEVAADVKGLLPEIQASMPGTISIIPIYDRSQTIVNSVDDVQETLLIAFALVVLVIFIFLGRMSETLIPAIAMPMSLAGVFLVMWLLGYSLDNLSLMGLTLVIGFLVDDAVVFLENTVRRMEQFGEGRLEATINSSAEISFTIMAMTVSLAAVFIPLVFMSGLMGRIFREFSVTIVLAIFASGAISLTLTPLMCSRMLRPRGKDAPRSRVQRVSGRIERRVLDAYGRLLWWFLRHGLIALVVWGACLVGTFWLFQRVPKAFLPTGDSSFVRGVFIAQEGSSPEQMRGYQAHVEQVLHANPSVTTTFTMSGNASFLGANQGLVLAFLTPPNKRPPIGQIAGQLMGVMQGQVPGTIALLQPDPVLRISTGATASQQGQYAYAISGSDSAELYDTARRLMAELMQYKGFATVSSDLFDHTPNLTINILRDQAEKCGIPAANILTLLRNAYSENYIYLIKRPTNEYQVIVEVEDPGRADPQDLSLLYIHSADGHTLVPLSAVATWQPVLGPQAVHHINQFTSVTFFMNLRPGVSLGDATAAIDAAAKKILPATVQGTLQGEALTFRNTVSDMLLLMPLAVFVMYVVLGILYESYLHPLTVLSALPVALVGGLATLIVFGQEASLYAFIGMFMLMGIVKKNGILIVDFAIQRIREGRTAAEAIHDASMDRFRPIMMTTLAATMSALPIAMGYGADGASRRPLGLVVVGGLIVSQFITLFVTPCIYLYLERFQEFIRNWRSTRGHKAQIEPAPEGFTDQA